MATQYDQFHISFTSRCVAQVSVERRERVSGLAAIAGTAQISLSSRCTVVIMKVLLCLLASLSAAFAMPEISADSALGQKLVSRARRVEQQEDEMDWEDEYSWLTSYSIKFQGCHSIKQWNDEADDEEDVRIATKNLIRFRLCPSGSCSATKAAGCTSGFGDYIIDMESFMETYFEALRQYEEVNCNNFLMTQCNCEDGDDQDDGFNAEYCEYDCFKDAEMYECIERNPYDDDEQEEQFQVEEYMECKQIDIQNDERRRKLEEDNGEEEEAQYFVGPYCGSQGGSIHLGLFTDDTCTTLASDVEFEDLFGFDLPYERKSLVGAECLSCMEPVEYEDQDANDQQDADAVSEQCEMLYSSSGKCESKMPEGMVWSPNTNACTYMEGVKIVRQDGIINTGPSRPNAVATAFIVISAMAFAALAFYVWYLRTRLGVKKNTLL